MKVTDLAEYAEHMRQRFLQDVLAEATRDYWLRRADQFAAVGTPAADEIAQACRNRAALALGSDETPAAVECVACGTPTSPWTCSCGQTRIAG